MRITTHVKMWWVALAAFGCGIAPAADRIVLSGVGIAPESVTSTTQGALIIGSATRTIYRVAAGGREATPWIEAPADGPRSVFGVFADERTQTLWACAGSVPASTSELYEFDLVSGKLQHRYPLPTEGGICNDIAVATDGTVFATDSTNMQILRLRRGAARLEVWAGAKPGTFGEASGIIDGIAVVGRRVLVNTLITRRLFSVEMGVAGEAGAVAELALDRELDGPDGMRSDVDGTLLVAETGGTGALSRVSIDGNEGKVRTVKAGFAHGAVAVTVARGAAHVLGNRPIEAVTQGEPARFEVVAVPLR